MSQTKKLVKETNKQNKYKWKLTNSDEFRNKIQRNNNF